MLKVLVLLSTVTVFVSGVSYEGYKAYKVHVENEEHNQILKQLENRPGFIFWTKLNRVHNPVSIIVGPEVQGYFTELLNTNNITHNVAIEDLHSVIEEERRYHLARPKTTRGITFDKYYNLDEINEYLEELAEDYPNLVSLRSAGFSYEGREIKYIKISNNENNTNPAMFIDAGIHAREWIAPAVALYIINQLVENPTYSNLTSNVDWYVLPSINPDGYSYTWTDDRLWRKTRTPQENLCTGVDPNRNWDFYWGGEGASNISCAEDFAGPSAFSENCTRDVRDVILESVANQTVAFYLSFHSYGPYILFPWGYDDVVLPENFDELFDLSVSAANSVSAWSGTEYEYGPIGSTLYLASGSTVDWCAGVANISLSYTIELNSYYFGFELPPEEILGVVSETFEAVKVFHSHVQENYAKN